jgi:hypothetical protein
MDLINNDQKYYKIKVFFANYISSHNSLAYEKELTEALEKIILGELIYETCFECCSNFKYHAEDKLSPSEIIILKFTIQYQNHVCFLEEQHDKIFFLFHSTRSNYYLIIIAFGKYKIFFIPRMTFYFAKIDYNILPPLNLQENNLNISIDSIS